MDAQSVVLRQPHLLRLIAQLAAQEDRTDIFWTHRRRQSSLLRFSLVSKQFAAACKGVGADSLCLEVVYGAGLSQSAVERLGDDFKEVTIEMRTKLPAPARDPAAFELALKTIFSRNGIQYLTVHLEMDDQRVGNGAAQAISDLFDASWPQSNGIFLAALTLLFIDIPAGLNPFALLRLCPATLEHLGIQITPCPPLSQLSTRGASPPSFRLRSLHLPTCLSEWEEQLNWLLVSAHANCILAVTVGPSLLTPSAFALSRIEDLMFCKLLRGQLDYSSLARLNLKRLTCVDWDLQAFLPALDRMPRLELLRIGYTANNPAYSSTLGGAEWLVRSACASRPGLQLEMLRHAEWKDADVAVLEQACAETGIILRWIEPLPPPPFQVNREDAFKLGAMRDLRGDGDVFRLWHSVVSVEA